MKHLPSFREDHVSQVPALQLLINLGYEYVPPREAERLRGGRKSNVLFESVLRERLGEINDITRRGTTHKFSEANVSAAILAVRHLPLQDGLINANAALYDLLTLGKSFEERIEGDLKSHSIHFIDWERPENNRYQVTEELPVTRNGRSDTYRPDIVCYVNGIPLVVIECKSPALSGNKSPVELGIEQHIRNFKRDGIRDLYVYSGLLLSLATNAARYATTGTSKEFWSVWKERHGNDAFEARYLNRLSAIKNRPLAKATKDELFSERTYGFHYARRYFDGLETEKRLITVQDQLLYDICRPERLLDLVRNFTVYDAGVKKVARYQQYFGVRAALERIRQLKPDGSRPGGVIWHTQGSGKSLTMVMLAQLLANLPVEELARAQTGLRKGELPAPARIILVTDRVDLDDQLFKTFKKCQQEVVRARTGTHLSELLMDDGDEIITTVINKFEAAVRQTKTPFDSPNIFVLIDEGHRTQYGSFNVSMERVFPKASFLAFTGTPLMKKEKNTAFKFGGYIGLPYKVNDAVEDGAVVPLLYEGRHNRIDLNEEPINRYFDRISEPLSAYGRNQLKKKFSTVAHLNRAKQVVYARAWDISEHYRDFFQTKGDKYKPKAQLVAPRIATALLYKKYLDEIGMVTSEVIVTRGDQREGHEDGFREDNEEKAYEDEYFAAMHDKYGDQKQFEDSVISQFKKQEHPEILIVVAKLLTGFDAPANTVLYLCRSLKEHTLLQAIARVNRVYPGKDYGYIIDYYGVLEDLSSALETYTSLDEFDAEDLDGALTNIKVEVVKLPQAHAEVWDIFKTIRERKVEPTVYEEFLEPKDRRDIFYEKLTAFAKLLKMALSTVDFVEQTSATKIDDYKKDLKFFLQLRVDVKRRYNDELSYREYEPKIQKLVDSHITTVGETLKVTELVDLFDPKQREEELAKISSVAAQADHIASRTTKAINVKMDEDPIYYKKLAELIRDTIAAYHQRRIDEAEYLKRIKEQEDRFFNGRSDEAPEALKGREAALTFYDFSRDSFTDEALLKNDFHVEVALAIEDVMLRNIYLNGQKIVDWVNNTDIANRIQLQVGDRIYDLLDKYKQPINWEAIKIIESGCLKVAFNKY
ncbi:restriction endonuclease subunit R [Lewinellaceae bacterium SD302]|nr:restriction endonuclease subunit R [Lewinellaceae bacterium SD302]